MRVKAVTAWREDIGEKCIRIPTIVREAIGVSLGDKVLATGPKGSVILTNIVADRTEIGQKVAGIDAQTRRALGVELGSLFTVSKPPVSQSLKSRTPRKPHSRSQIQAHRNTPTTWLFSYGSNNPEQLAERLGHPIQEATAAYLLGYSLCFLGYSTNRNGGVAGLKKQRNAEACGYVARVSETDLDKLDIHEGVRGGYYYRALLPVMVQTDDEDFTEEQAVVYLPGPARLNSYPHHHPSDEYLDAVEKTIFTFWDEDGECRGYLNQALAKVSPTRTRRKDEDVEQHRYRRNSDEHTRKLERQWLETGTEDAHQSWMQERRRAGIVFTRGGEPLGQWDETPEEDFWDALESVPPRQMWSTGHLVGEKYSTTENGEDVWRCYQQHNGKFWTALVTASGLNQYLGELKRS